MMAVVNSGSITVMFGDSQFEGTSFRVRNQSGQYSASSDEAEAPRAAVCLGSFPRMVFPCSCMITDESPSSQSL